MSAAVRQPEPADEGSPEERQLAWAYLSRVVEGASKPLVALINEVGPVIAARVVRENRLEVLDSKTVARREIDLVEQDLEAIARMGGRLVTPDSPEWPAWRFNAFALLDDDNTIHQRSDYAPPVALWVRGEMALSELDDRGVAIVGTRAASGYGEHVTAEIAGDLAVEGYTVVSGAAYGIDGSAHRAALGQGGKTVAVLACGLDRVYPAGHGKLLQAIARQGAVISEYPPGTVPAKFRFLARNRLVAALTDATLVVEAGWRSGARNTANWAAALGRQVLAVPGPVTAATSAGCHRMIKEGVATLVTNAGDVMEAAGPIGTLALEPTVPARPTDKLSPAQLQVYDGFPSSGAIGVAELSQESGLRMPIVMGALSVLELEGLVSTDGTGWFRK
ncbi:DNA-processing protein DprA [Tomitella biformata]|uniref:DNA-processing protein DprA n=1 Tax=Tomitella biformata TaxID=630403 RepID=UPI0006878960|nr:DNA-processing protein DprA [Tomitella biformata]